MNPQKLLRQMTGMMLVALLLVGGCAPAATPTPTPVPPTPTFTPTPTPTPTLTPTASSTATLTPSPTPTATSTPAPTVTPTPTATSTPTVTPTLTPTPPPTLTPTPAPTATPTPTFTPTPLPRRLATGTVIKQVGSTDGNGELSVENGLDLDAVAILKQLDGAWQIAVYIQNHDSFTVTGVPDSTYDLYFTLGEDWDSEQAKFTRQTRRSRFEEPFPFTTTETTYTIWSVTLHPVEGGTAGTEPVLEDEFPDLK